MAARPPMSLKPGVYEISVSGGHTYHTLVGRNPREDRSARPKPVFSLPQGVQPLGPWIVLEKEGGYLLKANGAPTGEEHKRVYAFLMGEKPACWKITHVVSTEGMQGWIVETEVDKKMLGWSVEGHHDSLLGTPISLVPLTATKSLPPQYLPHQVFIFNGPLDHIKPE